MEAHTEHIRRYEVVNCRINSGKTPEPYVSNFVKFPVKLLDGQDFHRKPTPAFSEGLTMTRGMTVEPRRKEPAAHRYTEHGKFLQNAAGLD